VDQKQGEQAKENPAAERADQSDDQQSATEQVQAEAAEERENERGYQ
jgi:hypothetical protein